MLLCATLAARLWRTVELRWVGVQFEGGVIIAADTLGSYGSMAKITDLQRVVKVGIITTTSAQSIVFSSVQCFRSVPNQLNPDPVKNLHPDPETLNPDPEPSYFVTLSEREKKIIS